MLLSMRHSGTGSRYRNQKWHGPTGGLARLQSPFIGMEVIRDVDAHVSRRVQQDGRQTRSVELGRVGRIVGTARVSRKSDEPSKVSWMSPRLESDVGQHKARKISNKNERQT